MQAVMEVIMEKRSEIELNNCDLSCALLVVVGLNMIILPVTNLPQYVMKGSRICENCCR